MTRFGSKMLALFVATALFGCEPQAEDQPQEGDPPGVDMDAEIDGTEPDADVTVNRPEITPDADEPLGFERPSGEIGIPTQTPGAGSEQETKVPEIDIDAPQTGEAAGQRPGDVQVPEVDLDAPATDDAAVTEEEGEVTLPEVDPGS